MADLDNPNLAGGTVSITAGLQSPADSLLFTDPNGITGSYNSATGGILTLSGTTTLANYQTALRSVTNSNTSDEAQRR